jgi:hypothetical protein
VNLRVFNFSTSYFCTPGTHEDGHVYRPSSSKHPDGLLDRHLYTPVPLPSSFVALRVNLNPSLQRFPNKAYCKYPTLKTSMWLGRGLQADLFTCGNVSWLKCISAMRSASRTQSRIRLRLYEQKYRASYNNRGTSVSMEIVNHNLGIKYRRKCWELRNNAFLHRHKSKQNGAWREF